MSRLFPIQNLVDALRADATLARDVYAYLEKEFPQFHPDYSAYREEKPSIDSSICESQHDAVLL